MKYGWVLLGLLMVLTGCSQEDDVLRENDTKEMPIMFNLLPSGVLGTKAVQDNTPDGGIPAASVREVYVDRVRLLVYKRKMGEYADNEEGFYLDKEGNSNLILPCIPKTQFPFFEAKGSIQLSKGYEYRVTAVGYSQEKGEQDLFGFQGDRFDHTQLKLTDQEEYKTPELFYGVPTIPGENGRRDSIFTYNDVDKEAGSKQLEGWLYRGIAGIEVNLSMKDVTDVKKIELLADSVFTSVGMQRYDNFHTPFNKVKDGTYKHFVLAVASLPEGETQFGDSVHLRYANLLPVCTSLSLRVTKMDEDESVHNTTLRLRETSVTPSESPALRSLPDDGGNGTGIIPDKPVMPDPEQPENPEDNPYRVCFKRNNYYRIKGDYKKLTLMRYVLQVTVNPNWEGDINLPLEKN